MYPYLFTRTAIDPDKLTEEINLQGYSQTLLSITVFDVGGGNFDVTITFAAQLTAPEETALAVLVAAHTTGGFTEEPIPDIDIRIANMVVESVSVLDPSLLIPSIGQVWFINGIGSGAWLGHDNQFAIWNGVSWDFVSIQDGTETYAKDTGVKWYWLSGIFKSSTSSTVVIARNISGITIPAKKFVAITGYTGGILGISIADKDDPDERPALGISTKDIPDGEMSEIIVMGIIEDVDTSGMVPSDLIVLGSNGGFLRPPPDQDPFTGEVQKVGTVAKTGVLDGVIFVTVNQELDVLDGPHAFYGIETSDTGLISGGSFTRAGGRNITVSAGVGFIRNGTNFDRIKWTTGTITLPANSFSYIHIDPPGTIDSALFPQPLETAIPLGIARTDSTSIIYFTTVFPNLEQRTGRTNVYLREVIGTVAVFGIAATIFSPPSGQITVDSGVYYTSGTRKIAAAHSPITFYSWYRNGLSGWTITSGVTAVDTGFYDDGTGTLAALPPGEYKKDLLVVIVVDGSTEYHLFYAQQHYSSQSAAESGAIPAIEGNLDTFGLPVGGIVSTASSSNIASIVDTRPFLGSTSSGVTAVSDHGLLSGLSDDDHTQYQLRSEENQPNGYAGLDGSTKLSGSQQVYGTISNTATQGNDARVPTQSENDALQGTNGAPSNVNRYVTDSDPRNTNSRTPIAHATSHQNGGSDEVATGTPTAFAIPKADATGKFADGWISASSVTQHQAFIDHNSLANLTVGNPHTQYQLLAEKNAPGGYPGLDGAVKITGSQQTYGAIANTATEGNDARIPTQDENDALQGTNGLPSNANRYVTDSDPRNTDSRSPSGSASGDLTGTYPSPTITANAVDDSKLRDSGPLSVIGRSVNTSGDPADISVTAATDFVLRESGSTVGFGQVATAGLSDNSVTNTKIRDSGALSVIGRSSNSSGDPADISTTAASNSVLKESGSTLVFGTVDTANVTNDAIIDTKLRNSGPLSVIGRNLNTTGDPADISATAASDAVLRESGSTVGFGQVATGGIADNAITNAKLRDSVGFSVIGKATIGTGDPADISTTTGSSAVLRESGGTLGFGTVDTAGITNDAVTNTKIRNSAALSVIGNSTNATTDPADISAVAASGSVLRESGSALGFGTVSTAGLAANAVDNTIIRDSGPLSVIGRSANTTGDPADISATAASDAVLRESGSVVGFGQVATGGIANDAITNTKIRNSVALSVIGNATNATADPADISTTSGTNGVLKESSGTLVFGDIRTVNLGTAVVTNAKLADMANNTVKARVTAGTGVPEDITQTQLTALLNVATTSLQGALSASDKTKLDNLVLARYRFAAQDFDDPNNADWPIVVAAQLTVDSLNNAIPVRRFDDTTEEGVSLEIYLPTGGANLIFRTIWRAQTTPPGTRGIQPSLRVREFPNNAAVEAWAETDMTPLSATVAQATNWQYASETISFTTLSLVAGRKAQIELTRQGADTDDTLAGDWVVQEFIIEVTP